MVLETNTPISLLYARTSLNQYILLIVSNIIMYIPFMYKLLFNNSLIYVADAVHSFSHHTTRTPERAATLSSLDDSESFQVQFV